SRRRHTRFSRDWSSDVCSSDLELTPRGIGLERPVETSLAAARPIHRLASLLTPIVAPLGWLTGRILRLFGIQPAGGHHLVLTTRSEERRVGEKDRAGRQS